MAQSNMSSTAPRQSVKDEDNAADAANPGVEARRGRGWPHLTEAQRVERDREPEEPSEVNDADWKAKALSYRSQLLSAQEENRQVRWQLLRAREENRQLRRE